MDAQLIGRNGAGQSAMRKAFWRILPLILTAYLFAYMDRVNIGFAAAEMNEDLKFSATVYGLGGGLFFLAYSLFAIPSNLMLVRFGARQWIALTMIVWGLLSAAMMFVQTPLQFYGLRFLLGVAEAGFYPGVIFYFAGWFPPCHRGRAVSRFFVASPLASVLMGGVSGWLLALDGHGGLHGWQWLFLAQGLPTVLFGLIVLRCLPDTPSNVAWLTPTEKEWIQDELAREQTRLGAPTGDSIVAAFRNPRVLLLGLMGFLLIGVVTTVILNAPMILEITTKLDPKSVGYIVGLGGLVGAAAVLFAGSHADSHGDRWGNACGCGIILAGSMLFMGMSSSQTVVVISYLAFASVCFTIPMLSSSGWAELLHARELAVGAAAINMLSQFGAFVGPYGWGMAKDATGSFRAALTAFSFIALAMAGLLLLLRHQVRSNAVGPASAVA